jgi:hypothetical protein
MSRVLIGVLFLIFCFAEARPAHAERYCLQGDQWGYPGNCSFPTYNQCRASASGTRAHCGVNPRYAHQRRAQLH